MLHCWNGHVQWFCSKLVSSVVLDRPGSVWVDIHKRATAAECCIRNVENAAVMLGHV